MTRGGFWRPAGRTIVLAALPAVALMLSVVGSGVAQAAVVAAPGQDAIAAGSAATSPILNDRDDHHCDGDHDGDDWGCRFYREHHQCDGDHDWDDIFCGWHHDR